MTRRATRVDDYPNRDVLDDIAFGLRKATVLKAAIELEIFTRIAEGHHTVAALAHIGGLSERGTRLLLDALAFAGLLTKQHGEYRLSPTAEAFLVKGKPSYYGDAALGDFAWDARGQLGRTVRTGKPTAPPAYGESAEPYWSGVAAASLIDWEKQLPDANALWEKVGVVPENGKPLRVLDVGSGAGLAAFALAKKYPTVRVTAADWPMVVSYAKMLADAMGIGPQVTTIAGDALALEFKPESFDLVLFGNITSYLSPEQNVGLFRKAYEALILNARVVVSAPMAEDEKKGPGEVAMEGIEALTFAPDGDIYSFVEYRGMLETAGFSEVSGIRDDWGLISARKIQMPAAKSDK